MSDLDDHEPNAFDAQLADAEIQCQQPVEMIDLMWISDASKPSHSNSR